MPNTYGMIIRKIKIKIINILVTQDYFWTYKFERFVQRIDDREDVPRRTWNLIYSIYSKCRSQVDYNLLSYYLRDIKEEYNYKCQWKLANLISCCDSFDISPKSHHENLTTFLNHLKTYELHEQSNCETRKNHQPGQQLPSSPDTKNTHKVH